MGESVTVESFTLGRTKQGAEFVTAKTGMGNVRFFDAPDVLFAKDNGAGVYSMDVQVNGNFKNGKNLSKISDLPVQQQVAQPAQNGQGASFKAGQDYRTPDQFMRTDAVHSAVAMVQAIFSRVRDEGATLEDVNAQALELYLTWFDIFETNIKQGMGGAKEQEPAQGLRPAGDVTTQFWIEVRKTAWVDGGDPVKAANAWLVGLEQFGKPFAELTPERKQEALALLLSAKQAA